MSQPRSSLIAALALALAALFASPSVVEAHHPIKPVKKASQARKAKAASKAGPMRARTGRTVGRVAIMQRRAPAAATERRVVPLKPGARIKIGKRVLVADPGFGEAPSWTLPAGVSTPPDFVAALNAEATQYFADRETEVTIRTIEQKGDTFFVHGEVGHGTFSGPGGTFRPLKLELTVAVDGKTGAFRVTKGSPNRPSKAATQRIAAFLAKQPGAWKVQHLFAIREQGKRLFLVGARKTEGDGPLIGALHVVDGDGQLVAPPPSIAKVTALLDSYAAKTGKTVRYSTINARHDTDVRELFFDANTADKPFPITQLVFEVRNDGRVELAFDTGKHLAEAGVDVSGVR